MPPSSNAELVSVNAIHLCPLKPSRNALCLPDIAVQSIGRTNGCVRRALALPARFRFISRATLRSRHMPVTTACEGFPRTADNSPATCALRTAPADQTVWHVRCLSVVIEAQRALRGDRYGRVQPHLGTCGFSAHSELALRYATTLADRFGATVEVLHVVEDPFVSGDGAQEPSRRISRSCSRIWSRPRARSSMT